MGKARANHTLYSVKNLVVQTSDSRHILFQIADFPASIFFDETNFETVSVSDFSLFPLLTALGTRGSLFSAATTRLRIRSHVSS